MTREEKYRERLQILTGPLAPLWKRGLTRIAGLDEAGRGPLAGPVVAACVVLPPAPLIMGIDDSKKLSEKRRGQLCEEILAAATDYCVTIIDVGTIEQINILESTRLAFQRSLDGLARPPEHVFTDAMKISCSCPLSSMIHADARVYTVAAASIVAKETRDRIMRSYGRVYPAYGFAQHKGYGTAAHREAIVQNGPCPVHRPTFLRKLLGEPPEAPARPEER